MLYSVLSAVIHTLTIVQGEQSKILFGRRLKAAREAKEYTKDKLGKLVGIHHLQIGRYERDDVSPSAEVLKKLANALDASTDYLMNGITSDLAAQNNTGQNPDQLV